MNGFGPRLQRLPVPEARNHLGWWLIAAVAVLALQQVAVELLGIDGPEAFLRRVIYLSTTVLLVGMALAFRRYLGAWVIAAGILMNLLPMAAHGGLMPIAYETIEASGYFPEITADAIGGQLHNSKDLVLERGDIRFEPLSDRYPLTVPGYGPNIYSLGDFVLFAGVGVALLEVAAGAVLASIRPRPLPRA